MTEHLHLGDEVEIVTDAFAASGAPRGSLGVIVDDWADGSNDVEVTDPTTGQVVARVRAAEGDIQASSSTMTVKQPRKHGIIFGRGDDLGAPSGDPPSATPSQFAGMPGGSSGVWSVGEFPVEEANVGKDIPWELQDEPPTGPVLI